MQLMEQLKVIEENARTNKSTDLRVAPDDMKIGQWIRQGDVYVQRIAKPKSFSTTYEQVNEYQLAPGNTRGSRHVASEGYKVYVRKDNKDPLVGPVIICNERSNIGHPEHAHFSLPGKNAYQVTYQKDWQAEQRARVRD
jgi:hypothetical protein